MNGKINIWVGITSGTTTYPLHRIELERKTGRLPGFVRMELIWSRESTSEPIAKIGKLISLHGG